MSPETERLLAASAVLVAYLLFCGLIYWRAARRPGGARIIGGAAGVAPVLVAYASQTGFAEELAQRTAAMLQAGAVPVRLTGLDALASSTLAASHRALFVVSTTGEGDAPDSAAAFVRKVMGGSTRLGGLEYGLLALGDTSYAAYCAFGRQLDAWLRAQGARPLFDRIEVDAAAPDALRHWQTQVEMLAGAAVEGIDLAAPEEFLPWRLVEREALNPDGIGAPVYRLAFTPLHGPADWQAGDIAVLAPRNAPATVTEALERAGLSGAFAETLATRQLPSDPSELRGLSPAALSEALPPLPRRDYSIASTPASGRLELLVRQVRLPDGRFGLGSGWLTEHVPIGGEVALRLRANQSFRAPDQDAPMILIGNGTGIAGLRAHLQARLCAGRRRNWLLFGERSRARDFLCGAEIEAWLAAGDLARLDLAFSREEPRRYVQDALRAAAPELRRWVAEGAVILVCGSLQGMAPAVQAVLQEELGVEALEELAAAGRYRRDVY